MLAGVVVAMLAPVTPALATGAAGLAEHTFSTGTVNPGQAQSWFWNAPSSDPNLVYFVGFDPAGATTSVPCQFEVVESWYTQQPGGGRQFHFVTQNVGSLTCTAKVILSWADATSEVTLPTLSQGASWNVHVPETPLGVSWAAGLTVTGATDIPCSLEIVRHWHQLLPGNNLPESWFTVENFNAMPCGGTALLVQAVIATQSFDTGTLQPGQTISGWFNNVAPGAVFFPGIEFHAFSSDTACKLEVTDDWYEQVVNPSTGTAERQYHMTVKNVGAIPCSGVTTLSLPPQ